MEILNYKIFFYVPNHPYMNLNGSNVITLNYKDKNSLETTVEISNYFKDSIKIYNI
jgi:hypothetical protein